MTPITIEERVERLEHIVDEMRNESLSEPGREDWRLTIGAFSDDSPAKEIIDEAIRLRDNERQQSPP